MAYASVTYTSASGTTFALTNSNGDPIPYIRQSDIKVYVNNVLQTVTTDYTFNTAGTAIVLNSPVSGATVLLQRITDITDPTVVYTAGSTLTAQDLNNADNQIRYGLQEFQDSVNAGGGIPDGDKGDITVAGNGTIWTIDSGAVVETKIGTGAVVEAKIGTGAVTSAKIADGTIVNADINASAAIAHSKLANITAGSVLLGDASNVPTATALSGDVTIDSSGVTAISSGVVVDADISASAEIAVSKLADGAARQLLQTDAAGTGVEWTSDVDIPGSATVTGDLTVDTDTLYVDSTNNRVGIGTTSPAQLLDISAASSSARIISTTGTNLAFLNFNNTAGNAYVGLESSTGGNFSTGTAAYSLSIAHQGAYPICFATSNTERVRIGSNGQFNTFDDGGNGVVARSSFGAGTSQSCFVGVRNATTTVNGTIVYQVYTNGTYATISDQRQKKNIETTRDGYLDDLKQLRVVKYHWNEQGDSEPKELGLIAQEVEQVFPGLVPEMTENGAGEAFKGVKTSVLPFMLLKALQEATAKIEALEAAVTALQQS